MRFKFDENFGERCLGIVRASGHDVETVSSESLNGCSDQQLYEVCCTEKRCLITLDLDFTNVVRFPPDNAPGVVVLRSPRQLSLKLLEKMVGDLMAALQRLPVDGKLWVVEADRIRIHGEE
jgi:predicted nuclease of predicted toxin-antitoxin system